MRALGAGVLGGTSLVHALPALAPVAPPLATVLGVPTRLELPGVAALTFDDGPHPAGTTAVLAVLEDAGVPATFFLAGEQAQRHPRLAAEILAAGHDVGLHCHRHRNMLRLTPRQVRDDLRRGIAAIQSATGRTPQWYRPPYGIFSAPGLAAVRRAGLRPMLWSRWGRDWRRTATPESIAARLTTRVQPGDVLLLHDADYYSAAGSWRRTVAALPRILETLDGHGLAPVTLAQAFDQGEARSQTDKIRFEARKSSVM